MQLGDAPLDDGLALVVAEVVQQHDRRRPRRHEDRFHRRELVVGVGEEEGPLPAGVHEDAEGHPDDPFEDGVHHEGQGVGEDDQLGQADRRPLGPRRPDDLRADHGEQQPGHAVGEGDEQRRFDVHLARLAEGHPAGHVVVPGAPVDQVGVVRDPVVEVVAHPVLEHARRAGDQEQPVHRQAVLPPPRLPQEAPDHVEPDRRHDDLPGDERRLHPAGDRRRPGWDALEVRAGDPAEDHVEHERRDDGAGEGPVLDRDHLDRLGCNALPAF